MRVSKKTRNSRKPDFGRVLKSKRQELIGQLMEWRQGVRSESVPEDEGGQASWAQMEHLAFTTLAQGQRTLSEVEAALGRMDRGTYGLCEGCGEPVPEARLRALPWARFCIKCTERHQRN